MSNALTAARDSLKAALGTVEGQVFTIVPAAYTPPAVVIEGDDPYISYEGAVFCAFHAHHRVVVIAAPGITETTAEQLDAQLLDVLAALTGGDHFVEDVGRPGSWSINGQAHPAVVVHVRTEIQTPEQEET